MTYITTEVHDHIESLKLAGKWDEATTIVNGYLTRDPHNEEALLHIADINYRRGDIDKAEKAVDFLHISKGQQDPMALYVKGVLAMEKLQRKEAVDFLKKANDLTDFGNHEIVRAFGVSQYRFGNREKGIYMLDVAHDINDLDAEIIYNIIELSLLERNLTKARQMIAYYRAHHAMLETFDKSIEEYDSKITLFHEYLSHTQSTNNS